MKDIPPRAYILDYKGLVTASPPETSDYVLSFDGVLSIDAEFQGNEARHINDFRGVAQRPNAEFDNYHDQDGVLHMGVFALHQRIARGSEILVSYGKGFWQERGLLRDADPFARYNEYDSRWDEPVEDQPEAPQEAAGESIEPPVATPDPAAPPPPTEPPSSG
mmetsp:Transcript_78358/g.210808  ORF Transcript_78358/g.210808 Transcript_78358/m.210808 type:complete len:163 (-) Transcript_78358:8-496(-)